MASPEQQQAVTHQPCLSICDYPPWQITKEVVWDWAAVPQSCCGVGWPVFMLRTGCESSPVLLCTNVQHKVPAPGWLHLDSKHSPARFTGGWSLLFSALSQQIWFDLFDILLGEFICMSNNTQYICFKLAHGPRYTLAMAWQSGYHSDLAPKPFLLWKPHCALELFPCKKLGMDPLKWANICQEKRGTPSLCRDVTDPTTPEAWESSRLSGFVRPP